MGTLCGWGESFVTPNSPRINFSTYTKCVHFLRNPPVIITPDCGRYKHKNHGGPEIASLSSKDLQGRVFKALRRPLNGRTAISRPFSHTAEKNTRPDRRIHAPSQRRVNASFRVFDVYFREDLFHGGEN